MIKPWKLAGGVGKSKRHDLVREVAVSGPRSGRPFVTFSNSHPMVGTSQVQLGETLAPNEAVKGFTYQGQQVPILDGQVVEPSIIDTKAEASIRLPIKKNWYTRRRLRRSNKPVFQVGLDVSLRGFQLHWP